jgi:RNA recognition motif-containing protein
MNLYVGNLAFAVTEGELEKIFTDYGSVESVKIITDRDTGRSKGFGFVEMADDEEAQNAIDALNDHEVFGRRLRVNEARPKPSNRDRGSRGGGYGGDSRFDRY